jgi:outer membrane protein assembly factor BamB
VILAKLNMGFGKLWGARVLALAAVASPVAALHAGDWPTFRGPDRTGVSGERNLLDSWGKQGPPLLWTAKGAGSGYASPAVADGRIYTLGDAPSTAGNEQEYLTCFSASDGQLLWQLEAGPSWNEHGKPDWNGARSTPTVDGERVYVITPFGKLICATTENGAVVWQRDLMEELGGSKKISKDGKKDSWGYSESPLIDGKQLLCTPGGPTATVVSLDKMTGELLWKCVREGDVGAGHSSIVISEVSGRKVYVQNTGGGPMGFTADGTLLWTYDMEPPTAFIPSPVIKDDYVFAVAGYGLGGALLQQIPGPGSSVSIKEIYGPQSNLANKHGGVILVGDRLYFDKEDRGLFQSADLMTGQLAWQEQRSKVGSGSASAVVADGKIYIRYANGAVVLANLSGNQLEEISSFTTRGSDDSTNPSWAHPVIANGQLLLREGDAILCYDISK